MSFKNEPPRQWAIMFDQDQDRFVWTTNDRVGKMNPIVTADKVMVEFTSLHSREQFEINRVTWLAVDSVTVGNAPPIVSSGTCKVVQPMLRQL